MVYDEVGFTAPKDGSSEGKTKNEWTKRYVNTRKKMRWTEERGRREVLERRGQEGNDKKGQVRFVELVHGAFLASRRQVRHTSARVCRSCLDTDPKYTWMPALSWRTTFAHVK